MGSSVEKPRFGGAVSFQGLGHENSPNLPAVARRSATRYLSLMQEAALIKALAKALVAT